VREQHALTYLPPLRSHSSISQTRAQRKKDVIAETVAMSEIEYAIDQQRKARAAEKETPIAILGGGAFKPSAGRLSTVSKPVAISPVKPAVSIKRTAAKKK
jgi:hypothetical protein